MSTEPTASLLSLGTYKANDADPNGCHGQAIKALRYLAENERPAYGSSSFNTEHLYQIADELERALTAIQKAAAALNVAPTAPGGMVPVQEAWKAAGGNPGIAASRQELLESLRLMNQAESEADANAELLQSLREAWPDAFAAFRGAFDTPVARRKDGDEYAEDARARINAINALLQPPELAFSNPLAAAAAATPEQIDGLMSAFRESLLDGAQPPSRPSSKPPRP